MKAPKPGTPVRGSRTGRPIMAALDLLGRRTALRIIWELRDNPLTFRALQAACDTNSSLLNSRLAELREARLVELAEQGYQLTEQGRKLLQALHPFAVWSNGWAKSLETKPDARKPTRS